MSGFDGLGGSRLGGSTLDSSGIGPDGTAFGSVCRDDSHHRKPARPNRRQGRRLARLALAVALALAAPGLALAQTAKERELEARVAQLESLVEQLMAQQQQTREQVAEAQAEVAEVKTAQAQQPAPVPEGKQPIQGTTIMTAANAGTAFSYGGFIKLDAMTTDTSDGTIADGSAGRLFYVPGTIPVAANGAEPDSDPYTDFHAQFSRFWFSADHVTDAGDKFKAYIEADLFGGGSNLAGNEVSTNTHALTVRHAYVSWNEWLAGQTWSNFMDVAALPDAVDFVGPSDSTIFVRQAQLRYSKGPWSFSLENPKTTVTSYQSAAGRITSNDGLMPDLTARWTTKGDWGHFSVAGLLRQFKLGDETATGGAVSVSGKFNLGANDDIRYAVNAGSGIGRYMAFGLGSDVVQDADGELQALDGYGAFAGWRHAFSPKLRGNVFYSMAHFDNDAEITGFGVTERAHSLHANLIYSPFPKLDVGAELTFGERMLEDDREGDLTRLHTHVKFSF